MMLKLIQTKIKKVHDIDLDTIKEGAAEAGTALVQVTTGLDEEQQKSTLSYQIQNTRTLR